MSIGERQQGITHNALAACRSVAFTALKLNL